MAQQKPPDPVALYEQAIRQTRGYIAGTRPADLQQSTPCTEWNVQALLDHIAGGAEWAHSVLAGKQDGQPAGKSHLQRYDDAAAKVLQIFKQKGMLEKVVKSPMGDMPGGQFLMFAFMDSLIHGWDLAKATGQPTQLDARLVEACYQAFSPQRAMLRASGQFAPEVPVPPNADTQTRLLGLLGRRA